MHNHLNTPEHQEQFRLEAQLLAQLEHRYILPLYEFGFDEDCPYLIAQYATGGSLRDRLAEQQTHPYLVQEALCVLDRYTMFIGVRLSIAISNQKTFSLTMLAMFNWLILALLL
jgi:serine/threonine protein kinase